LGSAIWRSTTLPKQAGLLIVIGILISFLGAGIPGFAIARAVGGILYGVGLAWLGYQIR
jgi:membrane associated rhomboid family serine protease